jgi:hypothetical protein
MTGGQHYRAGPRSLACVGVDPLKEAKMVLFLRTETREWTLSRHPPETDSGTSGCRGEWIVPVMKGADLDHCEASA